MIFSMSNHATRSGPAVAAGNTVILKASEKSPLLVCRIRFAIGGIFDRILTPH